MRVQFDATLDDYVDVATRCLARSKQIRKWRWDGLLTSGLMAWLAIYALFPGPFAKKMLAGFIGAIVAACVYPFTYRSTISRRLRKLCREQIGTDGPVRVQVELTDKGICTKQQNTQIIHEWANVAVIQETDDSIDFFMRDGAATVVRKRAFESEETKREFMDLSRQYVQLCGQPSSTTSRA
jgi:YcxB-like protein